MRSLAILLLGLLLFPITAAAQALVDRVPGDALIYVGWQGADAPGAAYEGSHLKAIVEASQIREFVSTSLPLLIEHIAAMNPDPNNKIVVPLLTNLSNQFWHHPTAIYIRGLTMDSGMPQPSAAIICDAGADAAGMVRQMNEALSAEGAPPQVTCQQQGTMFVLSQNDGPVGGVMLLQDADFKATMASLDAHPVCAAYANFTGIWKQVDALVNRLAPPDAQAQWPKIRDSLGLAGLHHLGMTAGFSGRNWSEQLFVDAPAPRTGVLAMLDSDPLDDQLLRRIPATATNAGAASCDLDAAVEAILGLVNQIDPDSAAQARQGLDQINSTVGLDVQKDFLDTLGTQWALYTDPTAGGTTILNRPRHADTLETSLGQLEKFANKMVAGQLADSGVTVEIRQEVIEGTRVHFLATPFITPAWAIKDGTLYISSYPQMAVASFTRPADAPSILDNPDWQRIRAALGGPAKISQFQFVDLPKTMPQGYQSTLMLTRLLLGAGDLFGAQTPAMVVPRLDKLMAQTEPGGSIGWSDDTGMHAKSIMPFPGADIMGTAGNASGIEAYYAAMMFAMMGQFFGEMHAIEGPAGAGMAPPPNIVMGGGGPAAATQTDITELKIALDAYDIDNGQYPTTGQGLMTLVNPPNGMHPYIDRVPADSWGHPYIYRCPGSNGQDFDLISAGPDGIPGTADDIGN